MAIGKRIDAATVTVQNETAKALKGILEHLDKAEKEKLKRIPIPGFCPHVLATTARLANGQLPIEDGEVVIAQALVKDMAEGVNNVIQFGAMGNGELTQTIALSGNANWSDLQSFVGESLDHLSAGQLAGVRR
jgi:hypothetical protein